MTKQEIHCHGCNKYVQFEVDLELDGNHVFECPECGHEHCRVVRNGEITGERWERRNGSTTWGTYTARVYGFTNTSTYATTASSGAYTQTTGSDFLRQAWYDSSSSTTSGGWR